MRCARNCASRRRSRRSCRRCKRARLVPRGNAAGDARPPRRRRGQRTEGRQGAVRRELKRLLDEKAQRIRSRGAGRDRSMEQLVTASRQSGFERQRGRLELWKNHRATTEELQRPTPSGSGWRTLHVEKEARMAAAARRGRRATGRLAVRHAPSAVAATRSPRSTRRRRYSRRRGRGARARCGEGELSAPLRRRWTRCAPARRRARRCGAARSRSRRATARAVRAQQGPPLRRARGEARGRGGGGGELERERRRAAADHAEATAAAARLGAEGDNARAELAAQRKLADSLKLELKKALARSGAG